MSDMLIKIQADATGWHDNLLCEAPYLRDGWAVVPQEARSMVTAQQGIVTFAVAEAAAVDYPDIVDRRTEGRGQPNPVATGMAPGTYLPPKPPPQPEPPTKEEREASARQDRDMRLMATDWTQVLDAPIDAATRAAYRIYRQALRDVPEQEGFPEDIDWPEEPAAVKADPDPVDEAFDVLVGGEADA